ncbi:DUF4097 family beta strand repeat-containing protein [Candidatus Proelusimicrobium excrementi]|uniref:DUF4097 family beta strand repeat-containing protein n=1 Tax=Candidatus Proelusimicrobium excrementi TaxID=3416222 RepID=UPI003C9E8E62|nr:DUF4097 family beta strand repeat protein [Elusimicrobiaceae bacterium]
MIKKIISVSSAFLCLTLFAQAKEKTQTFKTDSYTDIFISSQKADITVVPERGGESSVTWRSSLCSMTLKRPSENVVEIVIEPKKQRALLKKILMIPRSRCATRLQAGENKHIYASSQTGDIRFFSINSKTARAYTGQGVIETSDIGGNFTAETLTDRITIRNFKGKDLALKTVSGNVSVTGSAHDISILNTSGNSKMTGSAENLMFYSSQGKLSARWSALPKNPLSISAHSFSGDIKIYLPKLGEEYKNNSKIDLKTFYGEVSVEEK